MRVQVGIVGAGPAGLLLSQLLALQGVESVVLERHDRDYAEHRERAGVLEHGTVQTLRECGVAKRLDEQGLVHEGLNLRFGERTHRLDLKDLAGRCVTVYGQQEVVKDLIAARLGAGGEIRFGVEVVALHDLDDERPRITFGLPYEEGWSYR
jgi:p-hydroxybenzoate 3-monooxygenase